VRVLITGGTGFLGRHVRSFLAAEAPEAEVLAPGRRACDLAEDPLAVSTLLSDFRPEAILHLAGAIGGSEEVLQRDNERATAQLLKEVRRSCPQAMVVISSSTSVYGQGGTPLAPITEELLPRPQGAYARTKQAAEAAALRFAGEGLALVVARLSNPVGQDMSEDLFCGALTRQIIALERGGDERVLRLGDLTAKRDFLHVEDCARALWLLARSGRPGGIYNLAAGSPTGIDEVVRLFLARSRAGPVEVISDPGRTARSTIREQWISNARLRGLGWEPRRNLEEAAGEMLLAARAGPAVDPAPGSGGGHR